MKERIRTTYWELADDAIVYGLAVVIVLTWLYGR